MKRFVIVFFFFCEIVYGQTVSLTDAKSCASNFYSKYGLNKVPVGTCTVYGRQDCPDMYVFNMTNGGWIMISGVYEADPVLAVSFSGSFDTVDDMPEALKTIFDEYQYQISTFRRENRNSTVRHRKDSQSNNKVIGCSLYL